MKTLKALLVHVLILIISSGIFIAYMSIANLDSFPRMLEGTAPRPYIYRMLIPAIARMGAGLVPPDLSTRLENSFLGTVTNKTYQELSGGIYSAEASIALWVIFLSLAGFILVEKAFLNGLGYPAQDGFVISVTLAIMVLPLSVHFAYVYDLPQMFLISIGVLFLYRQNWAAYLLLLTVSLFNKETSFFLTIIFIAYYLRRLPGKVFTLLLGSQLGIFIINRIIIMYVFRNSPGVTILWSIRYHIEQYVDHPSTLIFTLVFFGGILYLVFKDWQRKPVFLRFASTAFFLMVVTFFLAGMPMEFRVFMDILPVIGIMLFPHRRGLIPLD